MAAENHNNAIFVGPWGSPGENPFDDGNYRGVARIIVRHGGIGGCIDSIQIMYFNNGNPVWSERHGGEEGAQRGDVDLDFPNEYLTAVSGHIGTYIGQPVIKSLKFTSNMATYGRFGHAKGTPFSLPVRGGKIVGFGGSFGSYLQNIGFYISQI